MTEVTALIEARAVTPVFQPVVQLTSGEPVGFEALARGPAGTRWESPVELFCAAAAIGRTVELDWACRARATEAALAAGLARTVALFVNTEPATLDTPCPLDLRPVLARAATRLRTVLELTERAVASEPAALLAAARAGRRSGCGVAFDNVGGDPAVLALLALAAPEIVKFDPYLLCRPLRSETVRMVNAVNEYAERSGAMIIATGIETEEQLRTARAMGATAGQGWLLGRPAPLLARRPASHRAQTSATPRIDASRAEVPRIDASRTEVPRADGSRAGAPRVDGSRTPSAWSGVVAGRQTPYDIVTARRAVATVPAAMLLPVARRLEALALEAAEPLAVLSCLRWPGALGADQWDWYAALARRAALVGLFGPDLRSGSVPGATVSELPLGDRLRGEWSVIVVGQQFAAALVARASAPAPARFFGWRMSTGRSGVLRAPGPVRRSRTVGGPPLPVGGPDRLQFAVSYDRDLVLAAAGPLLDRLPPAVAQRPW